MSCFFFKSPYNSVVFHPLHKVNSQGPFFHCSHGCVLRQTPKNGPPDPKNFPEMGFFGPNKIRELGGRIRRVYGITHRIHGTNVYLPTLIKHKHPKFSKYLVRIGVWNP